MMISRHEQSCSLLISIVRGKSWLLLLFAKLLNLAAGCLERALAIAER
jgi:hypothetical protein